MEKKITIEVMRGLEVLFEKSFCSSVIRIGRSPQSDIVLASKEISRKHLQIKILAEGFKIDDLSLNGFQSLSTKNADNVLPFGESFSVGAYGLTVKCEAMAQIPTNSLIQIRHELLCQLIEQMDLAVINQEQTILRPRVEAVLNRLIHGYSQILPNQRSTMVRQLADEALGLGPLEELLADNAVSEIMVVDPQTVYCERNGTLTKTDLTFSSAESVRTVIERIISPLGRRIDESSPMVDARLEDGSRVNAVIPPLAIKGPAITIRKFAKNPLTVDKLIQGGSLNQEMADFLWQAVASRRNIVISGGTGSGKTTLLNILSGAIPEGERIVTIEDAAELQLSQPHVVTLETRPPNAEGKGQVSIRDLVRNALRMRPDRIVVGECRGGEALDMLQAMNTGHDGSLTTTHANSPKEAVSRIETLCLMAGVDLPSRAIREQMSQALHLIVQQTRLADGKRKITSITEVQGISDTGKVTLCEIFRYSHQTSKEPFVATGWLPSFYNQIMTKPKEEKEAGK